MNKIKIFLIVFFLSFSIFCNTQNDENISIAHQELRALRDKVTTALNSQNIDELYSCFNKKFGFTTVDQTLITSREQLEKYYKSILNGERYKYGVEKMTIQPEADILTEFINENVGYCYGNCKNIYTLKGGLNFTINSRWTAIVSKKDGAWKIDTVHTGINFLDNPVIDFIKKTGKKLLLLNIITGILLFITIIVIFKLKKKS